MRTILIPLKIIQTDKSQQRDMRKRKIFDTLLEARIVLECWRRECNISAA